MAMRLANADVLPVRLRAVCAKRVKARSSIHFAARKAVRFAGQLDVSAARDRDGTLGQRSPRRFDQRVSITLAAPEEQSGAQRTAARGRTRRCAPWNSISGDDSGFPGAPWFKHVLCAPQRTR